MPSRRDARRGPLPARPADPLLRRARQLTLRAGRWSRTGDYRRAEAAYAASATLLRRLRGADRVELADVLTAHAEAKHQLDAYQDALDLAGQAYSLVRCVRGDRARTSRSKILGTLGNLHRALGDYRRAGPLLRRALVVARELGPRTRHAAIAMNNLGMLYKYTGRFARAEAHYRRALRITLREHGAEHPAVASLYHNIGGLAYTRERYAAAERWGRAAMELRTRLFGAHSVHTAADAAALAASLDGLGRHAEAQQLYGRVLAIFRRRYGACHYELAVNLNNLGASLYAEGKLAAASEKYREALHIKQRVLGSAHIDVALTANNLGILYLKQDRPEQAIRYVDQARTILLDQLGPRHPKARAVVANWKAVLAATRAPAPHPSGRRPRPRRRPSAIGRGAIGEPASPRASRATSRAASRRA